MRYMIIGQSIPVTKKVGKKITINWYRQILSLTAPSLYVLATYKMSQ